VGKGTIVRRLTAADPQLWLSRSWTTRARRPGEDPDAYVWRSRDAFLAHQAAGGFIETNELLGNLYGTPVPDPPPGRDVLLEIDINGAEQVLARDPDAVVVMVVPPSPEVQAARLEGRGDGPDAVAARLELGREEMARGALLAHHTVVNDDLEKAVAEVAGIIAGYRAEGA
jgi:guanylate kinase